MKITNTISVPDSEVELHAIRSQGPGGQNVNKVATAIHLRFDIHASSLPGSCKIKLLRLQDHRITSEGVIVIKAQSFRTQEKNREEALKRLQNLIKKATIVPKKRKSTKPTKGSQQRRMDSKTRHGKTKKLRNKENLQD
jgi:ribosome-associated protein